MSSRSSSRNSLETLANAQKYLYRFGGPIFVAIGIVNGLLGLIVFTQKSLRKNPCSVYFIAYNIVILLLICTSFLPLTLEIGYGITPTAYHLWLCRLRLYTTFVFNCLCPFYLLLASVDRALVTSPSARTRQLSTHRLAYISILIGTLFWIIGFCHVLVFSNIIQFFPNHFICYLTLGGYFKTISYVSLIKEITIPLSMAIFGLWSIRNVRNVHRITVPSTMTSPTGAHAGVRFTSVRSKDRQLILMLSVDITIYIFFSSIIAISLMHEQVTMSRPKNTEDILIQALIKNVAMFAAHIPFCINSYANLIVSKTFRNEVKELLLWKRINHLCQQH